MPKIKMGTLRNIAIGSCISLIAGCKSANQDYEKMRIPAAYIIKAAPPAKSKENKPAESVAPSPKPKLDIKPAEPKPAQAPAEKPPEPAPGKLEKENDFQELVYGSPEIKGNPVLVNNINALALKIQGYAGEQLYAVQLVNGSQEYWVGTADQIVQYDARDAADNRAVRGAMGVGSNVRLRLARPSFACNGNLVDLSELELIVDNERKQQ